MSLRSEIFAQLISFPNNEEFRDARFEVLTAVKIQVEVFCFVTSCVVLCCVVAGYRRFRSGR